MSEARSARIPGAPPIPTSNPSGDVKMTWGDYISVSAQLKAANERIAALEKALRVIVAMTEMDYSRHPSTPMLALAEEVYLKASTALASDSEEQQ